MAKLPEMSAPPAGVRVEKSFITYHDGYSREIFFTDAQYLVAKNMMIVSRTDKDGIITHVNDDFLDSSGYQREELIGHPHCLLRHPHMPRSAFREMWETINEGGIWTGAVKNLRKDGGYYWVKATIKPIESDGKIVGFHSVRKRLERDQIAEFEEKYAEMVANEG